MDGFVSPEEALRRLYAERAGVLAYIRAICGDPQLAEEVFQEVAALTVRKHAEIEPARVGAWARGAARRETLAALRRRARGPRAMDPEAMELLDREWEADGTGGERLTALRHCLQRLGAEARDLLALRYREGLSGADLAARLGLSENACWQRLGRLHRQLADCIRRRLAEAGDA